MIDALQLNRILGGDDHRVGILWQIGSDELVVVGKGVRGRQFHAQLAQGAEEALRVTDAGQRYLDDCKRILAQVTEADEAAIGINAAVIPHYDNTEGANHDTRFCYLGEARLQMFESLLDEDTYVLGVDEHTGLIIDIDAATAAVVDHAWSGPL